MSRPVGLAARPSSWAALTMASISSRVRFGLGFGGMQGGAQDEAAQGTVFALGGFGEEAVLIRGGADAKRFAERGCGAHRYVLYTE